MQENNTHVVLLFSLLYSKYHLATSHSLSKLMRPKLQTQKITILSKYLLICQQLFGAKISIVYIKKNNL